MEIFESIPKINEEKIKSIYKYNGFSIVFESKGVRIVNAILTKILFIMLRKSADNIPLKKLLDLAYNNDDWIPYKPNYEDFFQRLYDDNFFITSDASYKNCIKTYDNTFEIWPIHISFEVTKNCNLNCFFCFNDFSVTEKEMTLAEIENTMIKLRKNGLKSVELTGGEIFVRPDAFDIIDIVYNNVDMFFILTNGFKLDVLTIDKLKKYRNKLAAVGISLHSANEENFDKSTGKKGSFVKIINSIKLLKQNNFFVRVACPIIKQTFSELEKVCELSKKLDVDTLQFGINMLPDFIQSQYFSSRRLELEDFLMKMNYKYPELNLTVFELNENSESTINLSGCGAFSKNFVLTPSGRIKPCAFFPENSIFTLDRLGKATLSSKKMHIIQTFITGSFLVKNKSVNEICMECDTYSICSHCFYIRSLLNRDKSKCLLARKYKFHFIEYLKEVLI